MDGLGLEDEDWTRRRLGKRDADSGFTSSHVVLSEV